MNQLQFNLIPFNSNHTPPIQITGSISHQNNKLNIKYLLAGDLSTIIIAKLNNTPVRQDELWEHTCFEFFLKPKNTNIYWEFNLSPSGNWNVFRFQNYRANLTPEMAFSYLPFTVSQQQETLSVESNLDLNKLAIQQPDLDIAITTVIERHDQQLSYWALKHPITKPDFHHQDGFTISLKL
jgi:hypothetical protein